MTYSKKTVILIITAVSIASGILFLRGTCYAASGENPFISPFRVKQYKSIVVNPLDGIDLQGIIAASDPQKNIAIINGKPYYAGSEIMDKTIVRITAGAVYFKLANGRIIKLSLAKVEGFIK